MQLSYHLKDSKHSECVWIPLSAHDLERAFPSSNHCLFPHSRLLSPFSLVEGLWFLKQESGPSAARAGSHDWPYSMWLRGWPFNNQKQFPQDCSPLQGLLGGDTAMNLVRDKGMWGRVAVGISIKLKLWVELDSHTFSSLSCPLHSVLIYTSCFWKWPPKPENTELSRIQGARKLKESKLLCCFSPLFLFQKQVMRWFDYLTFERCQRIDPDLFSLL